MANIKDLKKRIKSTKNTYKITSAMKLVSAAKLARAQAAVVNSRPYAAELEGLIKTVSALVQNYSHAYLEPSENKHSVILLVSSNKGLCGGYNSNLAKEVRKFIDANPDEDFKIHYIGKKAYELLNHAYNSGPLHTFAKVDPSFEEVKEIAGELANLFTTGELGKVYLGYNFFQSVISSVPTIKQILPLSLDEAEREETSKAFPFDFKYDPNPKEILDVLIPDAFVTTIYASILEATAAEHGSRMAAMDNATRNCKEMIESLTLHMNKLRQAAITTELIEVMSGAEALNG